MVITIITFVVVLGLLVFVHELGHFLMAKKFGIRVDEFGFGFPPKIFGIKKGDTEYTLNWIPLGGFVKIKGETGENSDPDSFAEKKAWKRSLVLSAGVIMNFLLAFVLYSLGFMIGLPQGLPDTLPENVEVRDVKIVISEVAQNSGAENAGLLLGDEILKLDGVSFDSVKDIQSYLRDHNQEGVTFELQRAASTIDVEVVPSQISGSEAPVFGIGMIRSGIIRYGFFASLWQGFLTTVFVIVSIIFAFGTLIQNLVTTGSVGADVAGPVGVAVLAGDVARLGFIYILNFTAILSVNLGIINILPFPALDGGRLLFVIIEKIKGHPVNQKLELIFHNIGFALLLLLIVLVTARDIMRYGGRIWDGITSLF